MSGDKNNRPLSQSKQDHRLLNDEISGANAGGRNIPIFLRAAHNSDGRGNTPKNQRDNNQKEGEAGSVSHIVLNEMLKGSQKEVAEIRERVQNSQQNLSFAIVRVNNDIVTQAQRLEELSRSLPEDQLPLELQNIASLSRQYTLTSQSQLVFDSAQNSAAPIALSPDISAVVDRVRAQQTAQIIEQMCSIDFTKASNPEITKAQNAIIEACTVRDELISLDDLLKSDLEELESSTPITHERIAGIEAHTTSVSFTIKRLDAPQGPLNQFADANGKPLFSEESIIPDLQDGVSTNPETLDITGK